MGAISRYRFRVGRFSGVKPDGSNWSDPIFVGHFRDKVHVIENGVPREYWGNPYSPQSYIPEYSVTRTEQTWDETHGRPKARNKRDARNRLFYDTGGPFLNVKIDTGAPDTGVLGHVVMDSVGGDHRYEGGFILPHSSYWGSGWASSPLSYTSNSNSLLPDVAPYFDRAWRKAKPELETASLYVALRESRDLSRMLQTTAKLNALSYQKTTHLRSVQTDFGEKFVDYGAQISGRKMRPREIAEQFLNHQFGWAPFLKDLGQFYETWVRAQDTIKRITMENGQWVRKKVRVDKAKETTVISSTQLAPGSSSYALPCFVASMPSYFFTEPPWWDVVEDKTTTISAVGKFRFYRPEFDITLPDYTSAWNQVMRAVKIYGLSVNPYHIWQATPWTWLIDWVSNLGHFVERVSDTLSDSVAAAYFYITAQRVIKRRMTIHLPLVTGHQILTFERSFISKQRVAADSPYGFSLTWDALSPRRLAILGALGITRRPN